MSKKNNSNKKNKKIEEIEEVEETEEEVEEVEDIDDLEDEEEEEVVTKKKKVEKDLDDDEDEDDYKVLTVEERLERIEQKQVVIIVISALCCVIALITMLFVAGGVSTEKKTETSNQATQQEDESTASYDTSMFKTISASDIKDESKNETIVVMIGRQGCGFCAQFAPIIANVAEQFGITIRYIDITKVGSEGVEIIKGLTGSGDWKNFAGEYFGATPETIIIKNNKVVGGIVGAADSSSTAEAFKNAGLKQK